MTKFLGPLAVFAAATLTCTAMSQLAQAQLRVSGNHRYLTNADGAPFFYLGDTAWELFHRLDREEADRYLSDRAAKGFTVIQAVALAELDGLRTPNPYGHVPLVNNDPARPAVKKGPNNDYWDHVDYIVDKAASLGLHTGMLPTWGDKWNLKWGVGPEVFTPANAETYGRWLGDRYKDKPIIWILGGDRSIEDEAHSKIIRAMARGIEAGDGGRHLMTLHPSGRRNSATEFHADEWLDFNMIQSGHERPARPSHEFMTENLARKPRKPTLDGEPCYEDHPVKGSVWNRRSEPGAYLPWFDEWDVRRPAYESMLAGACGHTYGNHNIWQMWLPGREPISIARTPWPDALHHPGALQMKYMKGLFEARPFWKFRPDPSLLTGPDGSNKEAHAARADDGAFAVVYLPAGGAVNVQAEKITGQKVIAYWFNPRQDSAQLIGTFDKKGEMEFRSPSSGRNNDWVLVIDDASRELPTLGSSYQNFTPTAADTLELAKDDRVCIIGNVLAERMQHDGWLETLVQHRFPDHQLVFRNLGFSGDEPGHRLRSPDFGSPDKWLTRCQADVILAFFGFNESFADDAGLETFRKDLAGFIEHTQGQKYNGTSPPRLVLISPIACEDLRNPNLPDADEQNLRLQKYAQAMSEVANAHGVAFVDLFHPTRQQYEAIDEPLTINGHYLNERGNHVVAAVIDRALFSRPPPFSVEASQLERLRQAVVDKNFYWYHRYRTTDGFNVYGGRSHMRYTDDVSNREVMQREMEILDVMTANRDRRVWAVANGNDVEVDDGNTPPFVPVKTNKPGPHEFLGGEEAIEKMTVADGMQVNLVASDEMFPELINPVQMAFDPRGRLFVAVWPSYPHWTPKDEMNDKLLILEDADGDGRADRCKTFADGLNNPTGFEFWGGGVLIAMAPDLLFLKDTNGDDVADVRVRMLHGIDSADTHHTANSFALGPDGALYFQEGTFHQSQIESVDGVRRNNNGCVWRFEPRTWKVDRYVAFDFANPHGHVFNRWGQDIVHDGTGAVPYHAALFSGHLEYPAKHASPPRLYPQRTRPCPATEILSSRHFPEENQGNLLVANVIGVLGILQYKIAEIDSSFAGTEVEPILTSTDPNFRPSDVEIGPDGAIYLIDWQNPIIGHLQHHIRDPNRDKTHGRVYRITYPGRPLLQTPKIADASVNDLLQLLKEPEDRVRYRVRIELSGRDSDEVFAAIQNWIRGLDKNDPDYGHHILEALWLHQQHNVVNEDLLRQLLTFPDHRVRAAATRVLCYWRDRVAEPLELLKQQAKDEHPHVRLQAVRAASFLKAGEAIDVPLMTTEYSSDPYIEFTRGETMRALEPFWRQALDEERDVAVTSDAARRFLLQNTSTQQLLKTKRDHAVYRELLFRNGPLDEHRQEAVAGLAELENTSQLRVLLDAIASLDESQQSQSVVFDLVRLLTGRTPAELSSVRDDLVKMATGAKLPVVRQIGFVALIAADESVDKASQLASGDVATLRDLVSAMPLIVDPSVRASLYPKVAPLLNGLPASLANSEGQDPSGTVGQYVRVELPGRRRVLTLAEVEVYSDGQNVAPRGKASQRNTASGGQPERGIDGNKNGDFSAGGQTHTRPSRNPWWELDLGQEYPIDSVAIYNRTEGSLGERLEGFTLTVLDATRRKTFEREKNPAPAHGVTFDIGGGGPEAIIRRAAMNAVTYVRGKETEAFHSLAALVRDDVDRAAAIRALQRIPRRHWPKDEAGSLLQSILAYVRGIPTQDRTSPSALEAMQFADALAALLPADEARAARAELGDLGVRVIRIGTLPHRMAYDTERIVVEAGKPVEFVFENTDLMPHNFVITKPGTLEELGLLAESTAQEPDALERHYVPRSDQVLLASTLLSPSQSEVLSYVAPETPGVYPFVCTYPGHWRRMFGALYVVEDLNRYQSDPEAYMASNPLPVLDELLKFNRPRTEWAFEELASSVQSLSHGRSFGSAKQIFEVANCVACHRMNGVGLEIGPDLTKLDPKWQSAEILQEVLDPSKQINEKYFTYTFLLDSGKVVTGLVIEETADDVKVVGNPLANSQPLVLKETEIESRQKSSVSIMPKGLLDKLTREEILDLIAYVSSRGDPKHKLFEGEHGHGTDH